MKNIERWLQATEKFNANNEKNVSEIAFSEITLLTEWLDSEEYGVACKLLKSARCFIPFAESISPEGCNIGYIFSQNGLLRVQQPISKNIEGSKGWAVPKQGPVYVGLTAEGALHAFATYNRDEQNKETLFSCLIVSLNQIASGTP